jgi:hypothetical protein
VWDGVLKPVLVSLSPKSHFQPVIAPDGVEVEASVKFTVSGVAAAAAVKFATSVGAETVIGLLTAADWVPPGATAVRVTV